MAPGDHATDESKDRPAAPLEAAAPQTLDHKVRKLRLWARRVSVARKLAFALAAAAFASGLATLAATAGAGVKGPDLQTVLGLLYLDVVLLLALGVVVGRRVMTVWLQRRAGKTGSRLHTRFLMWFSLLAVTPSILTIIFAALYFNFGVQGWFSERVRTAVEESRAVAEAYLQEHQQTILADALAMAQDLNRQAPALMAEKWRFERVIETHAALRALPEAMVVDSRGNVIAKSSLSLGGDLEPLPQQALERAAAGEMVVLTRNNDDRVRAIVGLDRFVDAYLVVGRFVAPQVLEHIERTRGATEQYRNLEQNRQGIQVTFVMIFALVGLLLVLVASWLGLAVAGRLSGPVINLISAAERVRKGDMSVRVDSRPGDDELGTLARAFNRMTGQLETQRESLISANRELDERRRFTETVLAGVSAGVIGLDRVGGIHLPNRSASALLATDLAAAAGRPLAEVVPEMADVLARAQARPERLVSDEISLLRDGRSRTLRVAVTAERLGAEVMGYVVTFDDITELLAAQRQAAWADVARRIAHEIKNPLTPIQLSAERLKRRYLKQVAEDAETFQLCTDTIVRHVEDIGRMVDEFSAFARMPQPVLRRENVSEICRQAVFLERTRHPGILFGLDLPESDVHLQCDARQVGRAVTNILKNAAESVAARHGESGGESGGGEVRLATETDAEAGTIAVVVEDNGLGFPAQDRQRLADPYVTRREKGTGLGLAIVKKIMEDHNGELILADGPGGGACVKLVFHPLDERVEPGHHGAAASAGPDEAGQDPLEVATRPFTHGA